MKITGTLLKPASRFSRLQVSNPSMPRHDGIEQDDVGRDLVDDAHGSGAVKRDHHGHAGAVERVGEQPQRLRRVVDYERDVALLGFSDHTSARS